MQESAISDLDRYSTGPIGVSGICRQAIEVLSALSWRAGWKYSPQRLENAAILVASRCRAFPPPAGSTLQQRRVRGGWSTSELAMVGWVGINIGPNGLHRIGCDAGARSGVFQDRRAKRSDCDMGKKNHMAHHIGQQSRGVWPG